MKMYFQDLWSQALRRFSMTSSCGKIPYAKVLREKRERAAAYELRIELRSVVFVPPRPRRANCPPAPASQIFLRPPRGPNYPAAASPSKLARGRLAMRVGGGRLLCNFFPDGPVAAWPCKLFCGRLAWPCKLSRRRLPHRPNWPAAASPIKLSRHGCSLHIVSVI